MRKAVALPPIPRTLPTILGPAEVRQERNLRDEHDGRLLGSCNRAARLVKIADDPEVSLVVRWHTYWHEWMHMTIEDAGVEVAKETIEALCDAVANARVREMLDG